MIRNLTFTVLAILFSMPVFTQSQPADHSWIADSNSFTNLLLAVEIKHHPEVGSDQGLSQYDTQASHQLWPMKTRSGKRLRMSWLS